MGNLRKNQSGLVLTLLIIGAVVVASFIAWNNFIKSEKGQEIQDTANKVIETIEGGDSDDSQNLLEKIKP